MLHTALKDHLRLPDTRAVRTALEVAAIPSRAGVRSGVGAAAVNSAGVHTDDFPPLPPAQEAPMGDGVVAGQAPNNNTNNAGERSGKRVRVVRTDAGLTVFDLTDAGRTDLTK